jgi:hypothetical protein
VIIQERIQLRARTDGLTHGAASDEAVEEMLQLMDLAEQLL